MVSQQEQVNPYLKMSAAQLAAAEAESKRMLALQAEARKARAVANQEALDAVKGQVTAAFSGLLEKAQLGVVVTSASYSPAVGDTPASATVGIEVTGREAFTVTVQRELTRILKAAKLDLSGGPISIRPDADGNWGVTVASARQDKGGRKPATNGGSEVTLNGEVVSAASAYGRLTGEASNERGINYRLKLQAWAKAHRDEAKGLVIKVGGEQMFPAA